MNTPKKWFCVKSKNSVRYKLNTDLRIILLDHQKNYVECSSWLLEGQNLLFIMLEFPR